MGLRRSQDETPNAIVGAARRVNLDRGDEVERLHQRSTSTWQNLAWRYYDEIGEVKFAFNYFSSVASRVRLHVGYQDEASDTPVPIGEVGGISRSLVTAARHELSKLSSGRGGQPNLIRSLVLNLLVPGEAYLVGAHDSWAIRSTSELRFEGKNRIRLVLSRDQRGRSQNYLPESAFVARVWRTHPEYSDDADSSLKGVRSDCSELLLLSRIIRASARSRLNAGLLYVADELRFRRSVDVGTTTEPQPDVDPFEEELMLALTEPVGETDSPSEVVPMLVRGPAEYAESGVKHVSLSRGFDENDVKRYDQTLQRILNGLDIPKDIVTGLAGVRYSNAREITQDMYRAHVEPMVLLICEALTTAFLRPKLLQRGYDSSQVNRVHVWYDPSEVLVKPDRSEDADKGYARMLVSGSAWRRAHGFSDGDAPADEELVRRIALGGSVAPSTTLDFLRVVAPDMVADAERLAREAFGRPASDTTPSNGNGQSPTPPFPPASEPIGTGNVPRPETEPPEGSLPPRDDTAAQTAQVIAALSSLTAARTRSSTVVQERTRKLERALEVERRLRESLLTHLNDVVHRALERAGARTVSKIRGDGELKELASTVPIEQVFARIPQQRRAQLGLGAEKLVRDTIERARTSYVKLVTDAQRQAWRALGVLEELESTQRDDVESSWEWLAGALVALAVTRLREPGSEARYVDLLTVREATSRAGGAKTEVVHLDGRRSMTPETSGRAVLGKKAIDATGWEFGGYRWVYGVSENSFAPHLKLDGTVFERWESDALWNPEDFPGTRHYFPGDHDGCRCDFLPEVLDPGEVNAPQRGQTWIDPGDVDLPVAAAAYSGNGNGRNGVQSTYNGRTAVQEQEGRNHR